MTDLRIRQPRFADNRWYPADAATLEREIQSYLDNAPLEENGGEVVAVVAPHAGHWFSGHVAGASFSGLPPDAFEVVILIGPDHRGVAPGKISTVDVDVWRTPLGDISVDWDTLNTLHTEIEIVGVSYDEEHSLEIELPFLQLALREFKLVPLMMGRQTMDLSHRLGSALIKAVAQAPAAKTLLVASSDFSHFFDDATARRLDQATLQFLLDFDAPGLVRHVEAGRQHNQPLACGYGAIGAVMQAAQALGANRATLRKYATSADVHPAKDRVVGYAAVAFTKTTELL